MIFQGKGQQNSMFFLNGCREMGYKVIKTRRKPCVIINKSNTQ